MIQTLQVHPLTFKERKLIVGCCYFGGNTQTHTKESNTVIFSTLCQALLQSHRFGTKAILTVCSWRVVSKSGHLMIPTTSFVPGGPEATKRISASPPDKRGCAASCKPHWPPRMAGEDAGLRWQTFRELHMFPQCDRAARSFLKVDCAGLFVSPMFRDICRNEG